MTDTLTAEIEALQHMSTKELSERYTELHGQESKTRHRAYLIRKIAWRLQARAEGDLTERARRRAEELADDADVRVMAPRTIISPPQSAPSPTVARVAPRGEQGDPRLPAPGSAIIREYKGKTIHVVVLENGQGFEYDGERYSSLSAIAKKVTGSHMNGFRFFRLGGKK